MEPNNGITVSVWMTTYNHENYIAQAIESVLMQKTRFRIALVIGEDCSTDRTREIVLAYKEKHPDIIKLLLPEKNMGMIPMTIASYELCKGRYVACMDGDDYWTDPHKLQKQVDFMEKNSGITLCFHKVSRLKQADGTVTESIASPRSSDDTLTLDHFLEHCPLDTLSVLFRNIVGTLPTWYAQLPWPDWGLYCLLLQHGKAKYLDENMACYRIHDGGAYSGATQADKYKKTITFLKCQKEHLPMAYHKTIKAAIARHYFRLFQLDYHANNFGPALTRIVNIAYFDYKLLLQKSRSILSSVIRMSFKLSARSYSSTTLYQ